MGLFQVASGQGPAWLWVYLGLFQVVSGQGPAERSEGNGPEEEIFEDSEDG